MKSLVVVVDSGKEMLVNCANYDYSYYQKILVCYGEDGETIAKFFNPLGFIDVEKA